jgi:hypothetical protein
MLITPTGALPRQTQSGQLFLDLADVMVDAVLLFQIPQAQVEGGCDISTGTTVKLSVAVAELLLSDGSLDYTFGFFSRRVFASNEKRKDSVAFKSSDRLSKRVFFYEMLSR